MAAFNARVHYSPRWRHFEQREPHSGVAAGTRDLMSGDHPTCDASDFTVIEDTTTGSIVSSTCLIGQRFSYEGVEFDAGLPELVGTHPDYRRRGLIREQFEVLHRWSKERGHLMQAIAGIPYYYRRFGYEMAVYMGWDVGSTSRTYPANHRWLRSKDSRVLTTAPRHGVGCPLHLGSGPPAKGTLPARLVT